MDFTLFASLFILGPLGKEDGSREAGSPTGGQRGTRLFLGEEEETFLDTAGREGRTCGQKKRGSGYGHGLGDAPGNEILHCCLYARDSF